MNRLKVFQLFLLIVSCVIALYLYYDIRKPQVECIEGYVQMIESWPDPQGRFVCTKTK